MQPCKDSKEEERGQTEVKRTASWVRRSGFVFESLITVRSLSTFQDTEDEFLFWL